MPLTQDSSRHGSPLWMNRQLASPFQADRGGGPAPHTGLGGHRGCGLPRSPSFSPGHLTPGQAWPCWPSCILEGSPAQGETQEGAQIVWWALKCPLPRHRVSMATEDSGSRACAHEAQLPSHQGSHCLDGIPHGYRSFRESRPIFQLLASWPCLLVPARAPCAPSASFPSETARCFAIGTSEKWDVMEFISPRHEGQQWCRMWHTHTHTGPWEDQAFLGLRQESITRKLTVTPPCTALQTNLEKLLVSFSPFFPSSAKWG